ncbi:hypothetical protein [Bacillus kexueae]|uniref:hypothetical protein n=1 Tax=Aeribacillus kexueae TaxID=2078952 RepID=UPI001FAF2960|nr:hypothetical protein [Bacillus kexueae]
MFEKMIMQLNTNHLVKPLFPKEPIFIAFNSLGGCFETYRLSEEGIEKQENGNGNWHIKISGNQEHWDELWEGELRLQQLNNLRMIQVEGKYRDILRLESILTLCKFNR